MKDYPLDIEELREFEGGHMGWYSKGHHDVGAFLAWLPDAARPFDVPAVILEACVRHEWWRCVPAPREQFTLTVKAKPNTRGAFPVTVVEV